MFSHLCQHRPNRVPTIPGPEPLAPCKVRKAEKWQALPPLTATPPLARPQAGTCTPGTTATLLKHGRRLAEIRKQFRFVEHREQASEPAAYTAERSATKAVISAAESQRPGQPTTGQAARQTTQQDRPSSPQPSSTATQQRSQYTNQTRPSSTTSTQNLNSEMQNCQRGTAQTSNYQRSSAASGGSRTRTASAGSGARRR